MRVLWLASWYPNRTNPFIGDFIERHAKAVAKNIKTLVIIAVIKDEAMKHNQLEIEKIQEDNITVYRAYYGKSQWGGLVEKLLSFRKYVSIQKKIYKIF